MDWGYLGKKVFILFLSILLGYVAIMYDTKQPKKKTDFTLKNILLGRGIVYTLMTVVVVTFLEPLDSSLNIPTDIYFWLYGGLVLVIGAALFLFWGGSLDKEQDEHTLTTNNIINLYISILLIASYIGIYGVIAYYRS